MSFIWRLRILATSLKRREYCNARKHFKYFFRTPELSILYCWIMTINSFPFLAKCASINKSATKLKCMGRMFRRILKHLSTHYVLSLEKASQTLLWADHFESISHSLTDCTIRISTSLGYAISLRPFCTKRYVGSHGIQDGFILWASLPKNCQIYISPAKEWWLPGWHDCEHKYFVLYPYLK